MKRPPGTKYTFVSVVGNLVLAIFGLTIALGLLEMLMRTFPDVVPAEVRVNPPARRVKALIDETYDLRQSDGDLYHLMKGKVTPLSPDQDQVVARVHMVTDANGFRNFPPERETYDIVALGDSFTRASGVAVPWPQRLAEQTGSHVLNLAEVAFGPQDELKVLRQYGLEKHPQWIILAYFEGNDLYDAGAYDQANPFIITRLGRYAWNEGLSAWRQMRPAESQTEVASDYLYPIVVTTDQEDLEIVFFSYYVSWLSADRDTMEDSRNYSLVTDAVLEMQHLSETGDAHLLLVYVPSKEHIYLPLLKDNDLLAQIFSDAPAIGLDETGFLQFTNKRATPELAFQHMDDQAALLADFAASNGIAFLNLTPAFQEEAGTGAVLYYPFDTHWNQLGHDLAAEAINAYLGELLSDPATRTTKN